MVGEVFAGIGSIKTALDLARGLQAIHDATARDKAVFDLQKEILAAQSAQLALVEEVSALKAKLTQFEEWAAEKQRYELKQIRSTGVFAYTVKEDARGSEPEHSICPDCYQQGQKSILQQVSRTPGRADVRYCQRCGWEAYVSGAWEPAHGKGKR